MDGKSRRVERRRGQRTRTVVDLCAGIGNQRIDVGRPCDEGTIRTHERRERHMSVGRLSPGNF